MKQNISVYNIFLNINKVKNIIEELLKTVDNEMVLKKIINYLTDLLILENRLFKIIKSDEVMNVENTEVKKTYEVLKKLVSVV